ncbi:stress responsive a b barrel domain-containing protein [Colletotrichum asianum]|uniref:Stress responsive a b barrel domain-containing protein n=1 Tax=Colletotrichum asianum TaxID=702518 RepID=A0A8H3WKQ1_9PEZI|nr:stress responsive a b barrel domain-containing protein [Colletotrichum asianum]
MPPVSPAFIFRQTCIHRLRNINGTPLRTSASGFGYHHFSTTTTTRTEPTGDNKQTTTSFLPPAFRRIGTPLRSPKTFSTLRELDGKKIKMADRVHRVTMFKIADEGQKKQLIEQYKKLGDSQKKDGKPYILSMVVGPAVDDPRAQGFTIVAKTEFASLEDMKYYDDECAAHGALKSFVKENLTVGGVMSVYFMPEAVASL